MILQLCDLPLAYLKVNFSLFQNTYFHFWYQPKPNCFFNRRSLFKKHCCVVCGVIEKSQRNLYNADTRCLLPLQCRNFLSPTITVGLWSRPPSSSASLSITIRALAGLGKPYMTGGQGGGDREGPTTFSYFFRLS